MLCGEADAVIAEPEPLLSRIAMGIHWLGGARGACMCPEPMASHGYRVPRANVFPWLSQEVQGS